MTAINITGGRYGRWFVIKREANDNNENPRWLCRCDCGTERIVIAGALKNGRSKSCGCYLKEQAIKTNTTHGRCETPAYRSWKSIKNRCINPKATGYKYWGGRGIKVCERWYKFENFYIDMGDRPEGMSIDRIDNDGNYEPGNCRWATRIEQNQNTRSNRIKISLIPMEV